MNCLPPLPNTLFVFLPGNYALVNLSPIAFQITITTLIFKVARNTKESDFSPEIRMATPACVTCKASLLGYNGRARLGGFLWKRTEKKAALVSGLWDTVPLERIVSPRLSGDCRIAFCLARVRFTLVVHGPGARVSDSFYRSGSLSARGSPV